MNARLMRQILVDYARAQGAAKRGGVRKRVELRDDLIFSLEDPGSFLMLEDALSRLEKQAPRPARVVEILRNQTSA